MRRISWKSKRIGIICSFIFLVYLCLRLTTQSISTSAVFSNTKPVDVWEFVADFSNMKSLNPTIKDFNIISEEGNFDEWKYSVEYKELLSHWPYTENVNIGHFIVSPSGLDYVINSTHKTCFFNGIFCLISKGEFRFSPTTHGTRCVEKVTFECPAIFSSFCKREAEFQRQAIMDNLRIQFNPNSF